MCSRTLPFMLSAPSAADVAVPCPLFFPVSISLVFTLRLGVVGHLLPASTNYGCRFSSYGVMALHHLVEDYVYASAMRLACTLQVIHCIATLTHRRWKRRGISCQIPCMKTTLKKVTSCGWARWESPLVDIIAMKCVGRKIRYLMASQQPHQTEDRISYGSAPRNISLT